MPVYSSEVIAKGRFGAVDPGLFGSDMTTILWDEAFVSISVDDLTGIEGATLSPSARAT